MATEKKAIVSKKTSSPASKSKSKKKVETGKPATSKVVAARQVF